MVHHAGLLVQQLCSSQLIRHTQRPFFTAIKKTNYMKNLILISMKYELYGEKERIQIFLHFFVMVSLRLYHGRP